MPTFFNPDEFEYKTDESALTPFKLQTRSSPIVENGRFETFGFRPAETQSWQVLIPLPLPSECRRIDNNSFRCNDN